MAEPRQPQPALLVIAAFSRHPEVLHWAQKRLQQLFGPIGLTSQDFPFHQTHYYEKTMGPNLLKRFLAFQNLVPPDRLAEIKTQTNLIEKEAIQVFTFPEPRIINLDPGILQLGKFMLATVKDKDHRIYLKDGIFAEVTLRFTNKSFEPWPWTYADYREEKVIDFLNQTRKYYKEILDGQSEVE